MNLDELESVARAATPGPWHVDPDDRRDMSWNRHIMSGPSMAVCFMAHSDGKDPERDEATARHIAGCDPQTILKLIAVAKAAKAMENRLPKLPQAVALYYAESELLTLRNALEALAHSPRSRGDRHE